MGVRTSSNKVGGREQTEAAWFSLAAAMATQKLNTKRMERKPESCETATATELQAFCKHKMWKHILKIPQTLCVCVFFSLCPSLRSMLLLFKNDDVPLPCKETLRKP
jgi:hypothetical protein